LQFDRSPTDKEESPWMEEESCAMEEECCVMAPQYSVVEAVDAVLAETHFADERRHAFLITQNREAQRLAGLLRNSEIKNVPQQKRLDSKGEQPLCQLATSTSGMAAKALEEYCTMPCSKKKVAPHAGLAGDKSLTGSVNISLPPEGSPKARRQRQTLPKANEEARSPSKAVKIEGMSEDQMGKLCAKMSVKYSLSSEDVWWKIKDFNRLDVDGSQTLDRSEFQQAIRSYIDLPGDGPLPKHLLSWHWLCPDKKDEGNIDFEEFLLWCERTKYTEEVLVKDPQERMLRRIAREYKVRLPVAERVMKAFDDNDKGKTGFICLDGFRNVLFQLLGVKCESDISGPKLRRWWGEIAHEGHGKVGFEKLLLWYMRNFKEDIQ